MFSCCVVFTGIILSFSIQRNDPAKALKNRNDNALHIIDHRLKAFKSRKKTRKKQPKYLLYIVWRILSIKPRISYITKTAMGKVV